MITEKKTNMNPITAPVYCLESFLAMLGVRKEETMSEPNGLPQLRKQSWEPRNAKFIREEYGREENCTETEL